MIDYDKYDWTEVDGEKVILPELVSREELKQVQAENQRRLELLAGLVDAVKGMGWPWWGALVSCKAELIDAIEQELADAQVGGED